MTPKKATVNDETENSINDEKAKWLNWLVPSLLFFILGGIININNKLNDVIVIVTVHTDNIRGLQDWQKIVNNRLFYSGEAMKPEDITLKKQTEQPPKH